MYIIVIIGDLERPLLLFNSSRISINHYVDDFLVSGNEMCKQNRILLELVEGVSSFSDSGVTASFAKRSTETWLKPFTSDQAHTMT